MNFTNNILGVPNILFDNNSLKRFINSSESAHPFCFRDVIYNSIDFNQNCLGNVNSYIENYINFETEYSHNFLATSPDKKTKVIIRDRDLITFPKYFEDWKIESITDRTSQKHLNQFTSIHHHQFANLGIELPFNEMVEYTLVMNLIMVYNLDKTASAFNYLKQLTSKYTKLGIINNYETKVQNYCEWINFCFSLIRHFENQKLTYNEYNYNNIPNAFRKMNIIEILSRIDSIKNLTSKLANIELFCEKFDGYLEQEQLFVGMPIKLERRAIFYTL